MSYKVFVFNNQIIQKEKLLSDADIEIDNYQKVFEKSFYRELDAMDFYNDILSELREGFSIVLFYHQKGKYINLRQDEKLNQYESRDDFEEYIIIERRLFVRDVRRQKWNQPLRTSAENLLIAYDQMFFKIIKTPIHENSKN